jgi:hypothetical protein
MKMVLQLQEDGNPEPDQRSRIVAALASGVWSPLIIAEELHCPIESVHDVIANPGYGLQSYGISPYGGRCKATSENGTIVTRRVNIVGQMSYRRRVSTLRQWYRGRVAWVRDDAFGRQIVPQSGANPAVPNDLVFQSNWITAYIGTKQYVITPARIYMPELGRFLERDQIPTVTAMVKYTNGKTFGIYSSTQFQSIIKEFLIEAQGGGNIYVNSDPNNYVDASGLERGRPKPGAGNDSSGVPSDNGGFANLIGWELDLEGELLLAGVGGEALIGIKAAWRATSALSGLARAQAAARLAAKAAAEHCPKHLAQHLGYDSLVKIFSNLGKVNGESESTTTPTQNKPRGPKTR